MTAILVTGRLSVWVCGWRDAAASDPIEILFAAVHFGGKADIGQPLLKAAWRRFVACVEALPPDQAAPLWRDVQKQAAAFLSRA